MHRDVKPSNVLIADGDHVYLADFGLTKAASDRTGLTATGQIMGTIDYAAPEQIEGKPVDAHADVYALGCLLFECLTGEVPFPRTSELAVLWAHVQEAPPKLSERLPALPTAIDAVLAKALAKDPQSRYASCVELVEAARVARRALIGGSVAALVAAAAAAAFLVFRGGDGLRRSRRSTRSRASMRRRTGSSPRSGSSRTPPGWHSSAATRGSSTSPRRRRTSSTRRRTVSYT